ncbi:MAG: hypothetical protein ACI837_001753 [Crocinitomicaceae bacterium]
MSEVHPDLQLFIDKYISGATPLDLTAGFDVIGVEFSDSIPMLVPIDILSEEDNDVSLSGVVINTMYTIKKVGSNELIGLQKGDKIDESEIEKEFDDAEGGFVDEGTMIELPVRRDGQKIILKFPAKFKDGHIYNVFKLKNNKTELQQKLWDIWTTN